jgi:hypothetical protein
MITIFWLPQINIGWCLSLKYLLQLYGAKKPFCTALAEPLIVNACIAKTSHAWRNLYFALSSSRNTTTHLSICNWLVEWFIWAHESSLIQAGPLTGPQQETQLQSGGRGGKETPLPCSQVRQYDVLRSCPESAAKTPADMKLLAPHFSQP